MVSLKALKARKNVVQSTAKVTHVMKLVSVSKLMKVRHQFEVSMEYIKLLKEILGALLNKAELHELQELSSTFSILAEPEDVKRELLVVIGSQKGLCSSFNVNLAKKIKEDVKGLQQAGKLVRVLCIGDKVFKALKPLLDEKVILEFIEYKIDSRAGVVELTENIINRFSHQEFDLCKLYYMAFVSTMQQVPSVTPLIPMQSMFAQIKEESLASGAAQESFETEPDVISIIKDLVTKFLGDLMFNIALEAQASEHASRMVAMDNASKNAKGIIEDLNLMYNKQRQASITTELVEIISGAESIKTT